MNASIGIEYRAHWCGVVAPQSPPDSVVMGSNYK